MEGKNVALLEVILGWINIDSTVKLEEGVNQHCVTSVFVLHEESIEIQFASHRELYLGACVRTCHAPLLGFVM
jgi:hypothetical protein